MAAIRPSHAVLQAFGIHPAVDLTSISEGRGTCFSAAEGDATVILKPSDDDDESRWIAVLADRLTRRHPSPSYRLARPLPSEEEATVASTTASSSASSPLSPSYVFRGWTAWVRLPGTSGPLGRFPAILTASRALHTDLAALERHDPSFVSDPTFLRHGSGHFKSNRFREADLVAWDEKPLADVTAVHPAVLARLRPVLARLEALKRPVPAELLPPVQIIHGDLTGNVLFPNLDDEDNDDRGDGSEQQHQLGIIDFTPYRRPAAYADAIIVADGLAWFRQGRELIDLFGTDEVKLQLLVRALYWRYLCFAIDPVMEFVEAFLPKSHYPWAVDVVESIERANVDAK